MSKKSDSQDIASTLYGSAQTTNYLTNFDRFAHQDTKIIADYVAYIQCDVELRTQLRARALSY